MTTIAYRAGILAADSLASASGTKVADVEKVRRVKGFLIGISGNWGVACELFDWFDAELTNGELRRPPASLHVDDDKYPVNLLAVRESDGAIFMMDGLGYPERMRGEFFAIGSGWEIAIGAMAMGATAEQAIKAASRFDCFTGGRVKALKCKCTK